jgi:hypothetical protein
MSDETTLTIKFDEASGSTSGPLPTPPPPDRSLLPQPPSPNVAGITDTRAGREADRLGLLLSDIAGRVSRGLLTLEEALDRADRIGRSDAALDYARERNQRDFGALAREVLARVQPAPKSPSPPQLPAFDFTPAGGVPFDFTPGAKSPGSEKKPVEHQPFDFTPPPRPEPLPIAQRAPVKAVPVAERFDPGFFERMKLAFKGALPETVPLGKEYGQERVPTPAFSAQAEGIRAAAAAAAPGSTRTASQVAGTGLQVAESGLLGAGAARAAVAGGPQIAAAAMVLDVAVGKLTEGFEDARKGAQYLGAQTRALAGNDGIGLISNAADRAADQLDKIPIVGKAMAAAVQATIEPLRQLDQASRAFVARGHELAQYDERLSLATAMAEVRQVKADIREAERTGGAVARVVDAQSRLDVAFQDALVPLKTVVADRLADLTNKVTLLVEVGGRVVEVVVNRLPSIESTLAAVSSLLGGVVPGAGIAIDKIKDAVKVLEEDAKRQRDEEEEKLMNQFFDAVDALGLRPADPNTAIIDAQRGQVLGIPLLGG